MPFQAGNGKQERLVPPTPPLQFSPLNITTWEGVITQGWEEGRLHVLLKRRLCGCDIDASPDQACFTHSIEHVLCSA